MEKIKQLFEQCGVSPELSAQICEAIEDYKKTLREGMQTEFKARLDAAKKVCVEETEAHKRELARRVKVFCDAKGANIEAQIAKNLALSESDASAKLKSIASLVEGVEPESQAHGAATAEVGTLHSQVRTLTEQRDQAVSVANRANAIAEKALARNRHLQQQQQQAISESRKPGFPTRGQVRGRLDNRRVSGQRPVSTRQPLVENVTRQPPVASAPAPSNGHLTPESIAAGMDDWAP